MFDNIDAFAEGLKLIVKEKSSEISRFNIEEADSDSDSDSESGDVESLETWREISLVKVAVLRENNEAVEQLGALNSECNQQAIRLVYEFGYWKCLENLLEVRESKGWKPVRLGEFISFLIRAQTFDKDFREDKNEKIDFGKCVDLPRNMK